MKITDTYFVETLAVLLSLPLEETKNNVYGLRSANIDVDKSDGLLMMVSTKERTIPTTIFQCSDAVKEILASKISKCIGGLTITNRVLELFKEELGDLVGVSVAENPDKATVLVYRDRAIVFTDNYTTKQINHFGELTGWFKTPMPNGCLDRHDNQTLDEIDLAMGASCSGGMSKPNVSDCLHWNGHDSSPRGGLRNGESVLVTRHQNRRMNPAAATAMWVDLITLNYSGSIMSLFERVYHLLTTYQQGLNNEYFEVRECVTLDSEYDLLVDKVFNYMVVGEDIPSLVDVERAYVAMLITFYLASMSDVNYNHDDALHDLMSGVFGSKFNGEIVSHNNRYRIRLKDTFLGGIGEKLKAKYTPIALARETMTNLSELCLADKWNTLPMNKKVSLYRFFSEVKRFK